MPTTTRGPVPDPYDEPPDATAYARLRWRDLVDSLVALGVPRPRAREAVAGALVAHERGWARTVAEDDPDARVWAEACRLAEVADPPAYPPLLGHLREEGDTADLPGPDLPDPWLARARARRRDAVRRQAAVAVGSVAAVLLLGWAVTAWWGNRLVQPPVRDEVNELPVPWYADGELHLARVVVTLPDVTAFVPVDDAVVARLEEGRLVEVAADGEARVLRDAPVELDRPDEPMPPPDLELAPHDRIVEAVRGPGSVTVFLVDSRATPGAGGFTRGSESGRQAVLVCTGGGVEDVCSSPRVVGAGGQVSLR